MASTYERVIGTPGYLSEEQAMMADMEVDEASGWKPSREIVQESIDAFVRLGIPREEAECLVTK